MNHDEDHADSVLCHRFPPPGPLVTEALNVLDEVRYLATLDNKEAAVRLEQMGNPDNLPRPWDPPTCPPPLRAELWAWLDQAVTWHNHEYAWRRERMIPACWPHHPHLTHEIAVLMTTRHNAGRALTTHDLEEWHRWCIPTFLERLRANLGPTGCAGEHTHWPGALTYEQHTNPTCTLIRQQLFTQDTTGLNERD